MDHTTANHSAVIVTANLDRQGMTSTAATGAPMLAVEDAAPTASATAAVEAHIARWDDAGPADVELIEFVQTAVRLAAPRSVAEARTCLNYCSKYARWQRSTGRHLAYDTAFNRADIDQFLAEALPEDTKRGTRDAMRSHLLRLAPGVGLAGTTRPQLPKATLTLVPSPADPDADEIAATIAAWAPDRVAPEVWEQVADVVRHAVVAAAPERVGRAKDLMRAAAYLAGWVAHQNRPLRPDVVFSAATIEGFVALIAAEWPTRSAATVASNLHALREALGYPLDRARLEFPRSQAKLPYSSDEVAAIYARARVIPSSGRRRYVLSALDLVFGTGLTGATAGLVEPGWLLDTPAGLLLRIPATAGPARRSPARQALDADMGATAPPLREVLVLDEHADRLTANRDRAVRAGDTYMLGGTTTRRSGRYSTLMAPSRTFSVGADATRARLTWALAIVRLVAAHAGGLDDLRRVVANGLVLDVFDEETQ